MVGWDDVRRRLECRLRELPEGGFVVLGEAPRVLERRAWWRRQAPTAPTRYVQARRDGAHVYVECVGARSFGGGWEIDDTAHTRLRRLGWLVPGEVDATGVQPSWPSYWRVLPVSESAAAARMCVAALDVLGASPDAVDLQAGP
ncbi:MAG: hypothetical protein ABF306_16340 [Nocardioides marinisabuli]|uniref:TY-Chap domain-containing protein n=1 Tax=Nocardioides marinisabuli TaxID=419476 RepID=UPI0032190C14